MIQLLSLQILPRIRSAWSINSNFNTLREEFLSLAMFRLSPSDVCWRKGAIVNVSTLIKTTAFMVFFSSCAMNRTIVTRDIYKIDKDELASIEYLMGESINSFLGVRESLAVSDDELAGEEAVRAYVAALAACHQLPDIV